MAKERVLRDRQTRETAWRTRQQQWQFMEKIAAVGILWWCIWNKGGRPEAADEQRNCLLSGLDINQWIWAHRNWFRIGKWNESRYARPVRLTSTGREALRNRKLYEDEPIHGGMVDPGWMAIPLKPVDGDEWKQRVLAAL